MLQRREKGLVSDSDLTHCYWLIWEKLPRNEWTMDQLARILAEFIVRESGARVIAAQKKDTLQLLLSLLGLPVSGNKETLGERLKKFACTEDVLKDEESVVLEHVYDLEAFKFECSFTSYHDRQDLGYFSEKLYNNLVQRKLDDAVATELVQIITPSIRSPYLPRHRHQDNYLSWSTLEKLAFFSKRFVLYALSSNEEYYVPDLIVPELKRIMEILDLPLSHLRLKADYQQRLSDYIFAVPPVSTTIDEEIELMVSIEQLQKLVISNLRKRLIPPTDKRLEQFAISMDLFLPSVTRSLYQLFAWSAIYCYLNIDRLKLEQVKPLLSIFGFPTLCTLEKSKCIIESFFANDGEVPGIELDPITTTNMSTFNQFYNALLAYVLENKLPVCKVEKSKMERYLSCVSCAYLTDSLWLLTNDDVENFGIYSLLPTATCQSRICELRKLLRRFKKKPLVATTEISPINSLKLLLATPKSTSDKETSTSSHKSSSDSNQPKLSSPLKSTLTLTTTNTTTTAKQSTQFDRNENFATVSSNSNARDCDKPLPEPPRTTNSPSPINLAPFPSLPTLPSSPLSQSQPKRDISKFIDSLKSGVETNAQTRKKCWEDIFLGHDFARCPICSSSPIKFSGMSTFYSICFNLLLFVSFLSSPYYCYLFLSFLLKIRHRNHFQ
jgi:hypothetical protein